MRRCESSRGANLAAVHALPGGDLAEIRHRLRRVVASLRSTFSHGNAYPTNLRDRTLAQHVDHLIDVVQLAQLLVDTGQKLARHDFGAVAISGLYPLQQFSLRF